MAEESKQRCDNGHAVLQQWCAYCLADEIERLNKLVSEHCQAAFEMGAAWGTQSKEIERLRAALEKIAGEPGSWGNDYPATNAEISMERIAREALGAVVERDGWCMCGECNQRFPNAQALHDHKCNADETEPPR